MARVDVDELRDKVKVMCSTPPTASMPFSGPTWVWLLEDACARRSTRTFEPMSSRGCGPCTAQTAFGSRALTPRAARSCWLRRAAEPAALRRSDYEFGERSCVRSASSQPTEDNLKARVDLVLDCAEPAKLVEFWREALDYREYFTDTSFAVLVPKEGNAPPLVLQGVPEPRVGKNRMHLDIVVDDIEAEVERLASARRDPPRRRPPALRRHALGADVRSRAQRVLRVHRRRVVTTRGCGRCGARTHGLLLVRHHGPSAVLTGDNPVSVPISTSGRRVVIVSNEQSPAGMLDGGFDGQARGAVSEPLRS